MTTVPSTAAPRIATALVEPKLAACVNTISGVRSTYRWKGRVERTAESLLLVKTTRAASAACIAALRVAHPYDVPEILLIDPAEVDPSYLAWVLASVD